MSILKFIDEHPKGVRMLLMAIGAGATIATPFIAAKASENVGRRISESGATTKKEKLAIAAKEPLIWVTAGTSVISLGCGALAVGVSDRVIKKTQSLLDRAIEEAEQTNNAIATLPEKQKTAVEKAIIEQKVSDFHAKEEAAKVLGDNSISVPIDTGHGNVRFIAAFAGCRPFLGDYQYITQVINDFNANINNGIYPTLEEFKIKLGLPVDSDIDPDYFFLRQIKLVKDSDHFYKVDDCGQPVGVIEFESESKPEYLSPRERKNLGISYI